MRYRIVHGDALAELEALPDGIARCCVTSPPYWGLRDYGVEGQLGLEPTPEEYVERLVGVFREVRRVLADDGTLWLNLGDTYAGNPPGNDRPDHSGGRLLGTRGLQGGSRRAQRTSPRGVPSSLKPKDLVGIPWRVAFALQADGWYLRSDIVWSKPNPMPESVTDRPTKAHEYVFLLSKSRRYFYDAGALREPDAGLPSGNGFNGRQGGARSTAVSGGHGREARHEPGSGRNTRTVWTIATHPFPAAHFAVMPPALAERCILAGSAKGDLVLDPFAGAGTTGVVCRKHERRFLGIELNEQYARMARGRLGEDTSDDLPLMKAEDSTP